MYGCVRARVGDFVTLRSDIIMDVGTSLNPAIDVGQIEGAFTQGIGLFTMEEVVWQKNGNLLTRGPGAYKIPSFNDTPNDFRVTLMHNSANPVREDALPITLSHALTRSLFSTTTTSEQSIAPRESESRRCSSVARSTLPSRRQSRPPTPSTHRRQTAPKHRRRCKSTRLPRASAFVWRATTSSFASSTMFTLSGNKQRHDHNERSKKQQEATESNVASGHS